jgi:hypothetical protein
VSTRDPYEKGFHQGLVAALLICSAATRVAEVRDGILDLIVEAQAQEYRRSTYMSGRPHDPLPPRVKRLR